MNEVLVTGVLVTVGAVAGLLRACVAHRTRMQVEREASARAATRGTALLGLAGTHHDAVRIVEHDRDGRREVELGGRSRLRAGTGEAA
jgi:hypothetical protein